MGWTSPQNETKGPEQGPFQHREAQNHEEIHRQGQPCTRSGPLGLSNVAFSCWRDGLPRRSRMQPGVPISCNAMLGGSDSISESPAYCIDGHLTLLSSLIASLEVVGKKLPSDRMRSMRCDACTIIGIGSSDAHNDQ